MHRRRLQEYPGVVVDERRNEEQGVDAVEHDPEVFSADEAMVVLGVGKNMVKSIRHWGLATRIVEVDPADAARLGLADGGRARITTRAGSVVTAVDG